MERIVGYIAATAASVVGWQLGRPLGEFTSFIAAVLAAGLGMYFTRRWLHDRLN